MVEDTSGNQTMKCVGTYKPVGGGQLAPIINNKSVRICFIFAYQYYYRETKYVNI